MFCIFDDMMFVRMYINYFLCCLIVITSCCKFTSFFLNFVCFFYFGGVKHVVLRFPRGVAIFYLFILIFPVQAVACDKGKMPIKDGNVVISLDDLLVQKIGVEAAQNYTKHSRR